MERPVYRDRWPGLTREADLEAVLDWAAGLLPKAANLRPGQPRQLLTIQLERWAESVLASAFGYVAASTPEVRTISLAKLEPILEAVAADMADQHVPSFSDAMRAARDGTAARGTDPDDREPFMDELRRTMNTDAGAIESMRQELTRLDAGELDQLWLMARLGHDQLRIAGMEAAPTPAKRPTPSLADWPTTTLAWSLVAARRGTIRFHLGGPGTDTPMPADMRGLRWVQR